MSSKSHGFTLIELIIAIVIIGIGLTGVLLAFNTTVRHSADPMIRKQMLSLAEQMLEEILLKPYVAPTGSSGGISGCDRSLADEISDYAAYDQAACDLNGNALPSLADYRLQVTLSSGATLGSLSSADVTRIAVTVTHGADSLVLTGYRTHYAVP